MIELSRGDRLTALRRYAARFAKALEAQVAAVPLQWFNFYSFWGAAPAASAADARTAQANAQ